jgi:hypothetical protein
VEISPSDAVVSHALTWRGMGAETVKATEPCRVEVRFRAPVHLLILFEEGAPKDGVTCVEGLPWSGARSYKANSSSCHRATNTMIGRTAPAFPERHISISIRRCSRSDPIPGMPTGL